MIRIAIALASLALGALSSAADEKAPAALVEGGKIPELVLPDGKVYKDVTIRKVAPEGISILHADGAKMIYATDLPDALRSAGTFLNAEQVAAFRANEDRSAQAAQAELLAAHKAVATNYVPYVTPAQVKSSWMAKIPPVDRLSATYQSDMVSRIGLMKSIEAGDYDLRIERSAAAYNRELAGQAKDAEKSYQYETELARIDRAIADKAALDAANAYRTRLIKALEDLGAEIRQANENASAAIE